MILDAIEAAQNLVSRNRPRNSAVGPDPAVDPEKPITNDALHEAIEAYFRHVSPESQRTLDLALARAVYLAWAPPHLISIRRADGVRLVPPGLGIKPVRPQVGVPNTPLLVFTDERFFLPREARDLQVLYAWEVFDEAVQGPADGLLVNTREYPNLQLVPKDCRKVRRLLGRSGGDLTWPVGWPEPQEGSSR